ncbi:MAG: hypothetical protein LBQ22_11555 [Bacteroidales bacterium]|jgi:hypothetical protein|nr:hypothetical protein [Bacteroidales bacterium]
MKKFKLFSFLFVMMLSSFTACDKEETGSGNGNENENENGGVEININPENLGQGEIYIKATPENDYGYYELGFNIVADKLTIDWGDGTVEEKTNVQNLYHRYENQNARVVVLATEGLSMFGCYTNMYGLLSSSFDGYFEEIRFGSCPNLSEIYFWGGDNREYLKLKKVDITKLTALKRFWCLGEKDLSNLDVTKNTNLKVLEINKSNLSNLNLSNNVKLDTLRCSSSKLSTLNISANTALKYLDFSENQLSVINVENNKSLNYVNCCENQLSLNSLIELFQALPSTTNGRITFCSNPGTEDAHFGGHASQILSSKGWDYTW